MNRHRTTLKQWLVRHKKPLLRIGGGLFALLLLAQIAYPGDRMPLFARVDGVDVGGWSKKDATWHLDRLSAQKRVTIALGNADPNFAQPKPADIGINVSNDRRIESATYPWYLRIVPTSLFWFGAAQNETSPTYKADATKAEAYVKTALGDACSVPAKDATLAVRDSKLAVVPSVAGGTCQQDQAIKALTKAKPTLQATTVVKIPVDVIAPTVGDSEAKKLAESLNVATEGGVKLAVADKSQTVPQSEVLSWLTFKAVSESLAYEITPDKANAYFAKNVTPALSKPAGVTKVTTVDFTETARADGATGQTLSLAATIADITKVLSGEKKSAVAVPSPLPPKVEYTRSYTKSSTGIAALIKFYDEDNAGVFGVSFLELGGQGMSAQHNGTRQFVTASTYKLFVAFSTLKRVDAGSMSWSDANIAGGRDLARCFDDMIVKSDNACAEALIKKIGARDLNEDIKSLGLGSTAFRSDNNMTTANDLSNYLSQLEQGRMPLKPESRERLLSAMKRNVYRQGVPTGASGQTADKVGFLWGLLHDAAIVYSPKGTYVLAVMTDGSSWASIADLTRKIEALR
jgi:beta-lactamase class A